MRRLSRVVGAVVSHLPYARLKNEKEIEGCTIERIDRVSDQVIHLYMSNGIVYDIVAASGKTVIQRNKVSRLVELYTPNKVKVDEKVLGLLRCLENLV